MKILALVLASATAAMCLFCFMNGKDVAAAVNLFATILNLGNFYESSKT